MDSLPVVCRAWLQQDVPCEVVIAVADGTVVPDLGDGLAGGRIRIVRAGRDVAAPGPLRNIAAAAARAPVLYLSDADVVPLGPGFAGQVLKLVADQPVVQPWMYRLVNPAEATAGPPFELAFSGRACHVSFEAGGRLVRVGEECFTWRSAELLEVDPPPGVGWRKEDGTLWEAFPFHWGGVGVPREVFEAIGGYNRRYYGWGCEDDDLIAKLEHHVGIVRAWKMAKQLTCLHFEHPRSHTLTHIDANRAILEERLATGAEVMIEEDR
jgi:hypothetical protein